MSPAKPRVLLADRLDDDAERRLAAGAEIVRPTAPDEAGLCACLGDCDALIVRTHTRVTRAVLQAGRRLKVIGVTGVGLDQVDLAAAAGQGVVVLNTPEAASDAVAEFTVGLMLQLVRPIQRLAEAYRRGEFVPARRRPHGVELRDLTVGIVGMGRIGSRVGRICSAGFGARVLYNDIVEVGPFAFPAEPVDKSTLWALSDIVSLHVPLTDLTRGLVNAEALRRFRPSAYLINTARGAVVDTAALAAALHAGHLAGAALDVTEPEPLPADHPLLTMPQCTITPHVAARTHAGLRRMQAVVDDVLDFLRRGGA